MNFARVVLAAALVWVVSIGVGYVANDVLLADLYDDHAAFLRPGSDIESALPLGMGAMFLGFLAFSYSYAKGYEGGSGLQEGLRFGVLVGLMLVCFAVIWRYVLFPVSSRLLLGWAVEYIVEFALYGIIVGAIYKPLASPVRR